MQAPFLPTTLICTNWYLVLALLIYAQANRINLKKVPERVDVRSPHPFCGKFDAVSLFNSNTPYDTWNCRNILEKSLIAASNCFTNWDCRFTKLSNKQHSTSRTAKGASGSFKNRKPLGEIGCYESRMAEQRHWWIDRWLRSPLFLFLSCFFSDYLPTYLPIYLSNLSIHLSIDPFIDPSIYLSFYLHNGAASDLPKKWWGKVVLCAFWLENVLRGSQQIVSASDLPKVVRTPDVCVLRATTACNACNFLTSKKVSKSPNMVIFCALTSKRASRHSGAQFVIFSFGRRFSEPIFRPSGLAKHWKNTMLCDFPNISHTCIFFFVTLSLSLSLSLLLFSFSWLFPSLLLISAYCRKFDF